MGYGDEMMLAGEARDLRKRDPRKVAARGKSGNGWRWSPVFDHNPNFATLSDLTSPRNNERNIQWLDENAGRRYRISETKERRVWSTVGPARPELYLTEAEKEFARRAQVAHAIVVEPTIKPNASPNKDWGYGRWAALVAAAPGLPWAQLGPANNTRLLPGVRHVVTPDFRHAAAVLSLARAAVLPEGGLHHAAAAFFRPAVVLFGGYISPVQTGYPEHVNLFTGGEPCGMRVPCDHCKSALAAITPARVLSALDLILTERQAA